MQDNTELYGANDFRSYKLYHHGITGQRWGKRNGPPYPLNKDTSNRIKSQGQVEKYLKDREIIKQINEGKRFIGKFSNVGTGAILNDHDQYWEERYTTIGNEYLRGVITGKTKTSFTYQNYTHNGNREHLVSPTDFAREVFAQNDFDTNNQYFGEDRISSMHSAVKSMQINPNFGAPGTTNNCTKDTFVTELYRRGGNGISAGRMTYPASADALSYWFDGAHREKFSGDDAISSAQKLIDSYGDNASGGLGAYTDHSGHFVHWTKTGNKFSIEDGQCGRVYEGSDFSSAFSSFISDQPFGTTKLDITRLDDCPINWNNAAEDGCIRGNRVWNSVTKDIVDTW